MSTQLDPRTALIVVDMQKGILRMPPADAVDHLITSNTRLVDAFHAAELPVVWVHATGLPAGRVAHPIPEEDELPADFTEIADALPVQDGDIHIFKDRSFSAFPRTNLAETLRAHGITQVVLTGIATGAGVESTARSAFDENLNVTFAADAMLDGNPTHHEFCVEVGFHALGFVATTDEIVAALAAHGTSAATAQ